jgi:F-type H+-transporting ATPase subunit c
MNELEVAQLSLQGSKAIASGIAMMGAIGAGIGLGIFFGNLMTAIARNPAAKNDMTLFAYIGVGVIEAIAIFSLAIALINLFV